MKDGYMMWLQWLADNVVALDPSSTPPAPAGGTSGDSNAGGTTDIATVITAILAGVSSLIAAIAGAVSVIRGRRGDPDTQALLLQLLLEQRQKGEGGAGSGNGTPPPPTG